MPHPIVANLRQALAENGDPIKAEGMKRYMKSEMPYRGVQTPLLRRICKDLFRRHSIDDKGAWRDAVLDLWRNAGYREERYAAPELAGAKPYAPFRTLDTLPLWEELVVTGAWWDYVDGIASHRLCELLEKYPDEMAREMCSWSRDPDTWKRRSSIICQLNRRERTNLSLLFGCIDDNLADPDFFIRKGIGWALRSLAWTDLGAVEAYIARNEGRISALSRREALKNAEKIRSGRGR